MPTDKKKKVKDVNKKKKVNDDDKIYCGVKKVPKGHKLGTAEDCVRKNQVRHYGIEEIDPKLLKKKKDPKKTLKAETLKLQILQSKAQRMIREADKVKKILANEDSSKKDITWANQTKARILRTKDKLKKSIDDQKLIIINLEDEAGTITPDMKKERKRILKELESKSKNKNKNKN